MDFADEPYVRKYTRKTLTWKLLGWEGRAVLDAMLGEFDAAGIFAIRGDAAQCISAVTDIPLEVVRVGLGRLVETETWVVTARVITWPSYEEAQNCRRSDRLRQRESRRARSARSVTDVTTGHSESQPSVTEVTSRHPPSHPPSAPILPPSHPPERDPERARAVEQPLPEVPGLRVVAASSRVLTMPGPEPTKSYLDSALMAGVSRKQATDTWSYYHGRGLPSGGVERLEPWLVQMAKERSNQLTKAPDNPRSSGIRPTSDLDTTSAACAYRMTSEQAAFCGTHGLPLETALARCRGSPRFANLSTPEQEREMTVRLQLWRRTGAFPDPNEPLPRAKPKEARA